MRWKIFSLINREKERHKFYILEDYVENRSIILWWDQVFVKIEILL